MRQLRHRPSPPAQYAETLLKVATLASGGGPRWAVVGILPRRGKLEARIAGLIVPGRSRSTRASRLSIGCCLAVLFLISTIACGTTVREEKTKQRVIAQGSGGQSSTDTKLSPRVSVPALGPAPVAVDLAAAPPPADPEPTAAEEPAAEKPADEPSAEELAAQETFNLGLTAIERGESSSPEEEYVWSRRWMDARILRDHAAANRLQAAQAHVERMKRLRQIVEKLVNVEMAPKRWLSMADYYVADAERMVAVAEKLVTEKPADEPSAEEQAAEKAFEPAIKLFERGMSDNLEDLYVWSRRWMEAQVARDGSPAGRLKAAEAHAERMRELEKIVQKRVDAKQGNGLWVARANFYVAEAERMVAAAKPAVGSNSATGQVGEILPDEAPAAPALDRIIEIEQQILAERRNLETGRVQLTIWRPDAEPNKMVHYEKRLFLYFNQTKKRLDSICGGESLHLVSTPTSFFRCGGGKHESLTFEPQTPTPHADEIIDARVLGLAPDPLTPWRLDAVFANPQRQDLRVFTTGNRDAVGNILKVTFTIPNAGGEKTYVEYHLSPACDYRPIYLSTMTGKGTQRKGEIIEAQVRKFVVGGIWFPTEMHCYSLDMSRPGIKKVLEAVVTCGFAFNDGVDTTLFEPDEAELNAPDKPLPGATAGKPIGIPAGLEAGNTVRASIEPPDVIAARQAVERAFARYKAGWAPGPRSQYSAARRLLDIEIAQNSTPQGTLEAGRRHVERMKELDDIAQMLHKQGRGASAETSATHDYLKKAKFFVERVQLAGRRADIPMPAAAHTMPDDFAQVNAGEEQPSEWKVPSPDGLLAIERSVVASRQNLRTGRVAVATYFPTNKQGEPRRLQFERNFTLYFAGDKKRCDEINRGSVTHKISTPTSFVRSQVSSGGPGFNDRWEELFEPQTPTPHADEVADARQLGLVAGYLETMGQFSLDAMFAHEERNDLKIETGTDPAGMPVLKVSYNFPNKAKQPVKVEYWLAPRFDYLPVYYQSSSEAGEQTLVQSLRSKFDRYQLAGGWFPSEVIYGHEPPPPPGNVSEQVARVESAEFNLDLPPLTFERRGVETADLSAADVPRLAAAPLSAEPKVAAAEAKAASLEIPTPEELLKIEEHILNVRRSIRSGRLVVALYKPIDNDLEALELTGRHIFNFDGQTEREDVHEGNGVTTMLRTPTLFRRSGAAGALERTFSGEQSAKTPGMTDWRTLGLAASYFGNGGSLGPDLLPRNRQVLKIVAGVDGTEPVLKVTYRATVEYGPDDYRPAEIEYWLAPRWGHLPVYISRLRKFDTGSWYESIRVVLTRHEPTGICFPQEVVCRAEFSGPEGKLIDHQIARVESRQFNVPIDPALFESGQPIPTSAPAAAPQPEAKATPAAGLLDPEGISRLRLSAIPRER